MEFRQWRGRQGMNVTDIKMYFNDKEGSSDLGWGAVLFDDIF